MDAKILTTKLNNQGFIIIDDVYTDGDVDALLSVIDHTPANKDTFRKTADLFAIRQFLKEVPLALPVIFNDKLKAIISQMFGNDYFVTKAIYFDKPPQSNWFVAYHQDLTISVDSKAEIGGFSSWTIKQNQFAVQPPLVILQSNFTIRIHLDDTDEHNGALKVITGSNLKGIYRANAIDPATEHEEICRVKRGGIMVMRPLLLHASNRSTNNNARRVIHIEFSNSELPSSINWAERYVYQENY